MLQLKKKRQTQGNFHWSVQIKLFLLWFVFLRLVIRIESWHFTISTNQNQRKSELHCSGLHQSVIGLINSRYHLNQSKSKNTIKPLAFSRALGGSRVFMSCSHWLFVIFPLSLFWLAVVIVNFDFDIQLKCAFKNKIFRFFKPFTLLSK